MLYYLQQKLSCIVTVPKYTLIQLCTPEHRLQGLSFFEGKLDSCIVSNKINIFFNIAESVQICQLYTQLAETIKKRA